MNINPNQTKLKPVYKPGLPTRPLIVVRGYPKPLNQKAIQEYFESFGKLDQFIFHKDHITIQYAEENAYKNLRKVRCRFENKNLYLKFIRKDKRLKIKKNKKIPKVKKNKPKDTNIQPKNINENDIHNEISKNTNENAPHKDIPKNRNENTHSEISKKGNENASTNIKGEMNIINPVELINNLTKFKTADEQLMYFMKEVQLPHQEVETNYLALCEYLEFVFSKSVFVFKGCRTIPFGSTITGLAFKWSELDIFIQDLNVPNNSTKEPQEISACVTQCRKALAETASFHGLKAVKRTKIPYLRCTHQSTGITCNIKFKNMLGVCNSNLIYFLLNSDVRLRPMMMMIKYWAKINNFTGPGKVSNYALVMLVIFYLQQNPKSILPSISMLQDPSCEKIIQGWNAGYNNSFNFQSLNDYSIPYLLHGFYEFYGTYDFLMKVISPFTGMSISKTMFDNPEELSNDLWLYKTKVLKNQCKKLKVDSFMCVQDPFEHDQNLTTTVNITLIKLLQQRCKSASFFCRKAIESQSIISLLPQLLKPIFEIIITPSTKLFQNSDLLHERQRNSWYGRVNEILLLILKKVMKFDIKLAKCEQIAGMYDNIVEAFNIQCVGYYEIHHCRTRALKKIGNLVGLKREIAISDYVVENFNKANLVNKKPILVMDIVFIASRNPTRIILELKNQQEDLKSRFIIYEEFLQKWLPLWIEEYFEEKIDDILSASKSSECK